jgi:hypothetical protein
LHLGPVEPTDARRATEEMLVEHSNKDVGLAAMSKLYQENHLKTPMIKGTIWVDYVQCILGIRLLGSGHPGQIEKVIENVPKDSLQRITNLTIGNGPASPPRRICFERVAVHQTTHQQHHPV